MKIESKEWFERVLDSMSELVLVKGPKSRLLWANKAFCDYYGMSKAELRNIVDGPQSDPDDTLQYVKDDIQVFRQKAPLFIPSESVTKFDGSIAEFETVKSPIFEEDRMVESVGVSRQVVEVSGDQPAERERNKILTSAIRGITGTFPIPMLILDGQLRVVQSSPRWEKFFSKAEPGDSPFRTGTQFDIDLENSVLRCLETRDQQVLTLDNEVQGMKHIFSFEMSPWSYPDGDLGGVTIVAHDITEISESRRELRKINERHELVQQGASVGIWDWVDIGAKEEFWSSRFYELLGYLEGELEASIDSFSELLHPDDREMTFEQVQKHFAKEGPFDVEYRLLTKNGGYRWFRGSGKASFDDDGKPRQMVGSIQDIHDKKVYEEELKASNEELDQFAYIASHDLREPLRGMRNFSKFLMEDYNKLLDDTGKKYLGTIQKLGERLESYLDSLLQFSRLGREDMTVRKIQIHDLLEEVAEISRDTYLGSNLVIEISKDLPEVHCDPGKLMNIVGNLLQNAVRYNTSDEKRIGIVYKKRDEGLHQISVTDNGIGIRPEHQDLVFSPFKRLHGREQYGGGTGMGLALVKKAAERHGGEIWLESEPGKGSTFYFTFKEIQ